MFLKISRAVNSVILGQTGSILFQKENLLTLLLSMYFVSKCHKTSKQFSESESLKIRLDNFGPNRINYLCVEGDFWVS